ncbi:MAG TPA: twitching motility protein PilT [Firmicutes bacterium]|nr:twitching motility protein PilT [Bacillota bacterium]
MIQILAGEKGQGKTKRLIEMANEASKTIDGNVVFIDDDNRHMYDLHYGIRFVDTSMYKICDYEVFIGFIYGILSQNGDIQKIFVDGLGNIIRSLNSEDVENLCEVLDRISNDYNVDFTLIYSAPMTAVPDQVRKYLI